MKSKENPTKIGERTRQELSTSNNKISVDADLIEQVEGLNRELNGAINEKSAVINEKTKTIAELRAEINSLTKSCLFFCLLSTGLISFIFLTGVK